MQRQCRERPAMRGDPPLAVERAKVAEQRPRLGQRAFGRRRQQCHSVRLAAPGRKLQREARQVGGGDLGRGMGGHCALLGPRPHAPALPRRDPARATGALRRLGTARPFRHQPRHAAGRIEARTAGAAGIDDHPHLGDCQRGFRDRGRQHDPPQSADGRRRQRGLLTGEGQRPVKRQDLGRQIRQQRGDAPDLGLAGKERQQRVARRGIAGREGGGDQTRGLGDQPAACGQRPVEPVRLDRERPAFGADHRRVGQQGRDRLGLQRRRHHHQGKVRAQHRPRLPGEGKSQIGVQAALVELVEYHAADAGQRRIGLQHPRQDAFGDDLDAAARDALAPHPKPDALTQRLAQLVGQPPRGGAGGEAARLQHQDAALHVIHQRQRHARGLARTGRRHQHRPALLPHRRSQSGQHVVDR